MPASLPPGSPRTQEKHSCSRIFSAHCSLRSKSASPRNPQGAFLPLHLFWSSLKRHLYTEAFPGYPNLKLQTPILVTVHCFVFLLSTSHHQPYILLTKKKKILFIFPLPILECNHVRVGTSLSFTNISYPQHKQYTLTKYLLNVWMERRNKYEKINVSYLVWNVFRTLDMAHGYTLP